MKEKEVNKSSQKQQDRLEKSVNRLRSERICGLV